MSRLEQIEAQEAVLKEEKKLAKLEADFVEKKLAGKATQADREKLREAREEFRIHHRQPTTEGASPASIGAKAQAKETG